MKERQAPTQAITLWRPWCWAICHAGKRVENRGWRPPVSLLGQRLAIHSGKRWDADAAEVIYVSAGGEPTGEAWPGGRIVAVATVAGWVYEDGGNRTRSSSLTDGQARAAVESPWFCGPYGWVLSDVDVLAEPVPCRGAQGLWRVPPDVLAQLQQAVPTDEGARG